MFGHRSNILNRVVKVTLLTLLGHIQHNNWLLLNPLLFHVMVIIVYIELNEEDEFFFISLLPNAVLV